MKKLFILFLIVLISCSEDNTTVDDLTDTLFVFQKNTDVNTPEIFTKLFKVDAKTGELLEEIGGYEKLQARIYYEITYSNNEILTKQNVYQDGRGAELIKFNLITKEKKINKLNNDIFNFTAVNNRLFGLKSNPNSIDLVEVDELGNVLSIIDTYEDLPDAPSSNRSGFDDMTFSEEKNLLIVSRRLSFTSDAIDKLITYDLNTGKRKEVDIKHYESIVSGNDGRVFALATIWKGSTPTSKLIEINKSTGKELRNIYTFKNHINGSKELIFLTNLNQVVVETGLTLDKVDVDSGEFISTPINYDYRFISGLNMTR